MGVKESDGGGVATVGALELLYSQFQLLYVFAHQLCPRLAFAVVVLASFRLLSPHALLTGRLCSVAFLRTWISMSTAGNKL